MPHDIFISYSRRDLAAVKPIKEELENLGFSCWMDLDGIESGSPEFTEKIAEAIGGSTAVLFFLSTASQESHCSLNELRLARDEGKHVVLVRFNDDRMTAKFKLEFGGSDIIDWRENEQKSKLLRDLGNWTWSALPPCSQKGIEHALSARGIWASVKAFMEEQGIWDDFLLANRIEANNDATRTVVNWLLERKLCTREDILAVFKEARIPRRFTPLAFKKSLYAKDRGLWRRFKAYIKKLNAWESFKNAESIAEDDPSFQIKGFLVSEFGQDDGKVNAILAKASSVQPSHESMDPPKKPPISRWILLLGVSALLLAVLGFGILRGCDGESSRILDELEREMGEMFYVYRLCGPKEETVKAFSNHLETLSLPNPTASDRERLRMLQTEWKTKRGEVASSDAEIIRASKEALERKPDIRPPLADLVRKKRSATINAILEKELKQFGERSEPSLTNGLTQTLDRCRPDLYPDELDSLSNAISRVQKTICDTKIREWSQRTDLHRLPGRYAVFAKDHAANPYIGTATDFVAGKVGSAITDLAGRIEDCLISGDASNEPSALASFRSLNKLCERLTDQEVVSSPFGSRWEVGFAKRYLGSLERNKSDFRRTFRYRFTVAKVKLRVVNPDKAYDVGLAFEMTPRAGKKREGWILEPATKENGHPASEANAGAGATQTIELASPIDLEVFPFDRLVLRMTVRPQGKGGERADTKYVPFWDGGTDMPVHFHKERFFGKTPDERDREGRPFRRLSYLADPGRAVEVQCFLYPVSGCEDPAVRLRGWIDEAKKSTAP